MFVHDYIRNHLLEFLYNGERTKMPSLEELKKTEWSEVFEKLMRHRMIMGAFRYGRLKAPGKKKFDRVNSIIERLKLYEKDGNAEHLVDSANLAMLEFEEPNHPNFHFKAVDNTTVHTKEIK